MRSHLSSAALALFALFALASARAIAQATPTATGPGSILTLGFGSAVQHVEYGQRWLGGPQVWVDYNPLLHVGLEVEGRLLNVNQDLGTHAATLLAGPRVSLLRGTVEPYVKTLAGSGHFAYPYSYATGNYLVVAGGGGVDLHLGERLQVRIIDVEYQRWPKFSFGEMSTFGLSAGISFTLHKGPTWRTR